MTDKPSQFADGILDASVNFGVARITLAQVGSEGKPVPSGHLFVPVVQLPAFANGLLTLVKQIESKMKEAQVQAAPVAEAPAMPQSFTFGSR
jgi:hypothetical protein